jgi:hypothetical protein
LQHVCKSCQSIRAHEHYLRNAAAYQKRVARNNKRIRESNRRRLHDYLLVQKCYDCGLQDLAALDFDHRDPRQKRKDVSTLAGSACAWSAVLAEINKCDVVCANCHRGRTARYFKWRKLDRPEATVLPELPKRGTPDYERIKSRRSRLARRHRNRLLAWEHLSTHPCVLCAEDDPVVLDFDHIDDKYRDVGWLIAASCQSSILVEIAKCRVLCANCHRRHTATQAGRLR